MKFASETTVPVDRSKAEIERLLARYGAEKFASGWSSEGAVIYFEANARKIRFELPLPTKDDPKFRRTASGRARHGGKEAAFRAWEQECRQRWRALALVIKAKLEAVESGIAEFEEEFLSHIVLPNGETMGQWARPQIAIAYEQGVNMPPLLGMGG